MLKEAIAKWDGKSSSVIAQVYHDYHKEKAFSGSLIGLTNQAFLQKGATWLVKKYLESSEELSANETNNFFDLLAKLEHWEAKLHVLQCLPFLIITETNKAKLEGFLRQTLLSDNKFVRAWSYGGFYELAAQHKGYEDEVTQLLEYALKTEAPSVKARVRKLVNQGF